MGSKQDGEDGQDTGQENRRRARRVPGRRKKRSVAPAAGGIDGSRGKTREKLMDAALELLAEDEGGLAGLSLRAVTKRAGVSPTALYRHFPGLEELGLAVIDESSEMLRRMLREVRKAGGSDPQRMIGLSVRLFLMFVEQYRPRFLVMVRERAGGSARIRAAIRNTISYFSSELASDLRLMNVFPRLGTEELNRLAGMVISLAVQAIPDVIDLPPGPSSEADELADDLARQLQMLLVGAAHWDPGHAPDRG